MRRQDFEAAVATHGRKVYTLAVYLLANREEAEDVTQEVFITVHRVLDSWAGNSSLLVWIFGITRNKVNRRFRKAGRPVGVMDADAASGPVSRFLCAPVDRQRDGYVQVHRLGAGSAHGA